MARNEKKMGLRDDRIMNLGIHFDRAIRAHHDLVAISEDNTSITYERLGKQAKLFSETLTAHGFSKGDRVALLMPNCIEAVVVDGGLMKTGVIKVPLNARTSPAEIKAMLVDSGATMLVTHVLLAPYAQQCIDGLDTLKMVLIAGEGEAPKDWVRFNDFLSGQRQIVDTVIELDDIYSLNYTSGTSGVLKAAMLTHRNWLSLTRAYLYSSGLEPRVKRKNAYIAPITHAAGGAILANLITGGTNRLLKQFDPASLLQTIQDHKITDILLVPTMINMMLAVPDIEQYDLSSLDTIVYGTAPMSPARIKEAISIFGPVLSQGYGQTECASISMLSKTDHLAVNDPALAHRLLSAGRPSFECEVKILDDDGQHVPNGEIGEIVVRSDNVMKGYWNAPELTDDTLKDGWLHTRDLGRFDQDGFLYLVDRKSDMIISGGFNVYPAEVEKSLDAHPAVLEAAVFSVPDTRWGESVKAVVVLKPGMSASEQDLISHCKSELAHFKAPKSVDFVEALPKSPVGKILRRVIKERYWQGKDRKIN